MSKSGIKKHEEKVETRLYRAGSVVTSMLGAFGTSLRETRLTAMLGYIISRSPELFSNLFRLTGTVQSVWLETFHNQDRSDIKIETSEGTAVIEAKVGVEDPSRQILKYGARWPIILSNHIPTQQQEANSRFRYFTWERMAVVLSNLAKNSGPALKFLCGDLLKYLEDHRMIKGKEPLEIYAREINDEKSLNFFLKAQFYGCPYNKSGQLSEALYFAPYFDQFIASEHPGVRPGISYIAKIEQVEIVESYHELVDAIDRHRKTSWRKAMRNYISPAKDYWDWRKNDKQIFLLLGEPRLVFNPPIKKDIIQKSSGYLSKKLLSFDKLFEAWGK